MRTFYTKNNELKGQRLDDIFCLLRLENPRKDIGITNMFRYLEKEVYNIPQNVAEYDDLNEVPFTLKDVNLYIQSLGINAAVKKQ